MGLRDMLPENAKDFKDNIDKKTVVVLIVGILVGVVYVDGIPLSYSKVTLNESTSSHFELTKMKLPFLKTSITIKYMVTDSSDSDDNYEQRCISVDSFDFLIDDLIFIDSNDGAIWSSSGGFQYTETSDSEFRNGNPDIEIKRGTTQDDSCSGSDSVWHVKIKMNGNPVKVQDGLSVRTF